MLLSLLHLDYERVDINLPNQAQLDSEFIALNPLHKVPVLMDESFVLRDRGGEPSSQSSAATRASGCSFGFMVSHICSQLVSRLYEPLESVVDTVVGHGLNLLHERSRAHHVGVEYDSEFP